MNQTEMLQREIQVQQLTKVTQDVENSKSTQALKMVTDYKAPMNRLALPESLSNHKETVMAKANQLSAEYRSPDVTRETLKYQIDLKALPPSNALTQGISPELNVKAITPYF